MLANRELAQTMYIVASVISFALGLLYNFLQFNKKKTMMSSLSQIIFQKTCKKSKLTASTTWLVLIEIFLFSFLQILIAGEVNTYFGIIAKTGINYFGSLFITPIILTAFCFAVWVNPLQQIDLFAPSFAIVLFLGKLGCFFKGCCHGIEWQNGIYNYKYERFEVPIQLIESIVALLILLFLLYIKKRAKNGTMFPIYTIVFSATRFFTEFLRAETNVLGPLKTYQILCIIGVAVGIAELVFVKYFGKQLEELFSQTVYGDKSNLYYLINKDEMKNKNKKKKK